MDVLDAGRGPADRLSPKRPTAAPSAGAGAGRRGWLLALVAVTLSGCTLVSRSTRPTPDADRNLFCRLEYRPDPGRPGEPDVLFLAGARPYKLEEATMSLPDGLLHGLFAPGRHLVAPVHLRGVHCEPPIWEAGHRIPGTLRLSHHLLCRREGLEQVEIEVRTKWGSCRQEIPAGDRTPRCGDWHGRDAASALARLSDAACPSLPPLSRDSRRGSTPCGAHWAVVHEGTGATARPGDVVRVHETVVDRRSAVVASTHFGGEPRRIRLGGGDWAGWLEEGVIGMREGERRRFFDPCPRPPEPPATGNDPAAVGLLYHDVELLAIEVASTAAGEPSGSSRRPDRE